MLQLSGYLTAGVVRDGVFAGTVESEVLGEEFERGEDVNTPLPGEPEIQIKLWGFIWRNIECNWQRILNYCYAYAVVAYLL